MLWSEHFERHSLPSLAAACGIPKDSRDFLGRWRANQAHSNDYVLTSKQVIHDVQIAVSKWVCSGAPDRSGYDEAGLWEDLKLAGIAPADWVDAHAQVLLPRSQGGGVLGTSFPCLKLLGTEGMDRSRDLSRSRSPRARHAAAPVAEPEQEDHGNPVAPGPAPFWLSVSRKGHRRAHRVGGCGARPFCRSAEDLHDLVQAEIDDFCRHCWREKSQPQDSSDSRSAETSSSDESLSSVKGEERHLGHHPGHPQSLMELHCSTPGKYALSTRR